MSTVGVRRPPRPTRNADDYRRTEDSPEMPMATAVIATFQQAGANRRRALTNGSSDREREQKLEDERRRQLRIRERAPGRRPTLNNDMTQDTNYLLDQISTDWAGLIDGEYNPIDLALQLQEETSREALESFQRTQSTLSRALSGTAHDHHHAFDGALPHHTTLLTLLGNVQTQVSDVRTALQESKDALGNKRSDLAQLRSRRNTIEEMLRLLDQIEYLKVVPDALESSTSGKQLLKASVVLVRSLKTINEQDLLEVGAVADLRSYLTGQETTLKDILIDELHNHLYLRSMWSENQWATSRGRKSSKQKSSHEGETVFAMPTDLTGLHDFLRDLEARSKNPPFDLSDPRHNQRRSQRMSGIPSSTSLTSLSARLELDNQQELDSFSYLETLLESLSVLGKLNNGLDVLRQRLPNEISSLVDRTLEEVAERADIIKQTSVASAQQVQVQSLDGNMQTSSRSSTSGKMQNSLSKLAVFDSAENTADQEVLRDLLWTLYMKLDIVTQGLRAIYEISNRINMRKDPKDTSADVSIALLPLTEVWPPIQNAMRGLLKSYLSGEERSLSAARDSILSIGSMLREGKVTHDRTESLFHFADTDQKPTGKDIKKYEDDLMRILGDTVPGLQNLSGKMPQTNILHVGGVERPVGNDSHRLLISSDASNLGIVFDPTIAFLQRAASTLPSAVEFSKARSSIFDDFVLKIYLPQLEEKAAVLLQQALTGLNTLQADRSSFKLTEESLVQAGAQLVALMDTIRTTPFHKEFCASILVGLIIQFYQRCNDRFQSIVSRYDEASGETHMIVSAGWAQKTDVSVCLTQIMNSMEHEDSLAALCDKETRLEYELLGDRAIDREDLLPSSREIASLGRLYRSLAWFMEQLRRLDSNIPEDQLPSQPTSSDLSISLFSPSFVDDQFQLPQITDMTARVDALFGIYRRFLEVILHTLRLEMRCRVLHYIGRATSNRRHSTGYNTRKPDSYILDLNDELCACEEALAAVLPEQELQFVFEGLGSLMENLLVSNASSSKDEINARKRLRNILALRQSLKTMSSNPKAFDFEQALSRCAL